MNIEYTINEYGRATRINTVTMNISEEDFREAIGDCDTREEAEEALKDYLCNYEWDNVSEDYTDDFECDDTEHLDDFYSAVQDLMDEYWVEPEEESSEDTDDSAPEDGVILL